MIDDTFWLSNKYVPLFTVENNQEQLFCFKETILNHISLNRLLTRTGLTAQMSMLPNIMKFLFCDILASCLKICLSRKKILSLVNSLIHGQKTRFKGLISTYLKL